jgi:hypothetical protein
LRFGAFRKRTEEGCLSDFFVADRNAEPSAELAQFFFVQFFLLMRDVAAFAGFAQAVAFDGLGQDNSGYFPKKCLRV